MSEDLTKPTDGDSDLVKQLREEIKQRNEAISELSSFKDKFEAVEREKTIANVGIDMSSPTGRLFSKAYDGELTEDAIREAAVEYGLIETQQSQQQAEAATHQSIDKAASGASGAGSKVDPSEKAWDSYNEIRSKTGNDEAAMAGFFASKLNATLEGKKGA